MTLSTASTPAPPGFAGFGGPTFAFLRALEAEQNREWFHAHKSDHEDHVRTPMAALIAALSDELAERGIPLRGDPWRSQFRIQRGVRFAADKRPYKTHAGATLTRDGGRLTQGLLYVHIDPLGCFMAAGFHRPDAAALRSFGWQALDGDGGSGPG